MRTFITAFAITLMVLPIGFWSCRKTNETPKVNIVEPNEGSNLIVGDTAYIKVSAEDDDDRIDLSIQLKDVDLIAEGPIKRFRDLAPGTVQVLPYFIEDKSYSSGTHFIKAIASDGELDGSDFLEVEIEQSDNPERLYVLEEDGNEIVLSTFRQGGWNELARLQERVSNAVFWEEANLLMIQTQQYQLLAMDLSTGEIRWTKDFVGSGAFFATYHVTPELFIQASNDEFIRGYDFNGNLDLSIIIPTGYGSLSISATHDYLMSYEKSVVGSQYLMRLYSLFTSQLIRDRAFPFLNPILLGGSSEIWMLNPGSATSDLRCLDEALTQFPVCQSLNYGADAAVKSREDQSVFLLEANRLHILAIDGSSDDVIALNQQAEGMSHTTAHFCVWYGAKVLTYQRSDRNLILNPETSHRVIAAGYF